MRGRAITLVAGDLLTELLVRARSSYVSPYDFAVCYAGLGNGDEALCSLGYAYRVMRIIRLGDPSTRFGRSHGSCR